MFVGTSHKPEDAIQTLRTGNPNRPVKIYLNTCIRSPSLHGLDQAACTDDTRAAMVHSAPYCTFLDCMTSSLWNHSCAWGAKLLPGWPLPHPKQQPQPHWLEPAKGLPRQTVLWVTQRRHTVAARWQEAANSLRGCLHNGRPLHTDQPTKRRCPPHRCMPHKLYREPWPAFRRPYWSPDTLV